MSSRCSSCPTPCFRDLYHSYHRLLLLGPLFWMWPMHFQPLLSSLLLTLSTRLLIICVILPYFLRTSFACWLFCHFSNEPFFVRTIIVKAFAFVATEDLNVAWALAIQFSRFMVPPSIKEAKVFQFTKLLTSSYVSSMMPFAYWMDRCLW